MDDYKKLAPANKDIIVRDPVSKTILDINGELKPYAGSEGTYWRRRVEEGTVIILEDKIEKKEEVIFDDKNNLIKKGGK
jgi:hypothetical protein